MKAKTHNLILLISQNYSKFLNCCLRTIHHSLASLSLLFKHKSLSFVVNLTLFLHHISIFWLEHLYILPKLAPELFKVKNELLPPLINRSSRPEVFCKKDILRNFAKFTGKHLCWSLFFDKVAGLGLRAPSFTEHLWFLLLYEQNLYGKHTALLLNEKTEFKTINFKMVCKWTETLTFSGLTIMVIISWEFLMF